MQARELREAILKRYSSIHAFCRQHPELKRATVYQVISGRYAGQIPRQINIIRAVLEGREPESTPPRVTAAQVAEAVQEYKCGQCRRLDKPCASCRTQTLREAEVVERLLTG